MAIKRHQKVSIVVTDAYPVIINALLGIIGKMDCLEILFYANSGEELLKKLNANGKPLTGPCLSHFA